MLNQSRYMQVCMAVALAAAPVWLPAAESASVSSAAEAVHTGSSWEQALVKGPSKLVVANQGTVEVPAGYGYLPAQDAQKLLESWGNLPDSEVKGMIIPLDENLKWSAVVSYTPEGYIKDDDAKDLNAAELLKGMQDSQVEANKQLAEKGMSGYNVVGWVEPPHYDATAKRLIWGLELKDNAPDGQATINYNTRALGREGYISMNLLASTKQEVEQAKPAVGMLLSHLTFNDGKRYADFNPATDRVAEYGVAALIAGVAAKKLGLLAVIAAFFAKSFKLILLVGAGLLVGLKKFFSRNKEEA